MEGLWNFPFGQKVKKVEQKDKTQKKVFVLGVYASAVHAKWLDAEGNLLARALIVGSEPEIFWRGDIERAKEIIDKINLPKEAGNLFPADKIFNGPSGIALDDCYLKPLKITRNECWLCDLVPYSMLNPKQKKALERNNELFERYGLQKHNMEEAIDDNRKIDSKRINEILSEIKQSQAKYLITLGNEPLEYFLSPLLQQELKLNLKDPYGEIKQIELDGNKINWLALVHPRQAAKLGMYSKEWNEKHKRWINEKANSIKI